MTKNTAEYNTIYYYNPICCCCYLRRQTAINGDDTDDYRYHQEARYGNLNVGGRLLSFNGDYPFAHHRRLSEDVISDNSSCRVIGETTKGERIIRNEERRTKSL